MTWGATVMTHLRILLAFVAALVLAVPALAAPAITLSRTIGPPTSSVTVNGSGFPARQLVDIYFDTGDECVVATSSTGKLSCKVSVPAKAQPGTHFFTVSVRSSGFALQKSFLVRTDWTQFKGFNAGHAGFNHLENTITAATVPALAKSWSATLSSDSIGSFAVYDGKVYVLSSDAKLHAFDALSGRVVPGFPVTLTGATFTGGVTAKNSPVIGAGKVFVCAGGATPKLFAFNAKTGATSAGFPVALAADCTFPVAVAGTRVYAATAASVQAFSTGNGAPAGSPFPIALPSAPSSAPTVVGNELAVNFGAFSTRILDATTGNPNGTVTDGNGGSKGTTPSFFDGQYYVARDSGTVFSTQTTPAFTVVSRVLPAPVTVEPAVARGRLIVATNAPDLRLYAVDASAGNFSTLWSAVLPGPLARGPVMTSDLVFVAPSGQLRAYRLSDGALVWSSAATLLAGGPLTIANGVLYVGLFNHRIQAYKLTDIALGPDKVARPLPSSLKPDYRLKPVRN
jgi:hypothetical protein